MGQPLFHDLLNPSGTVEVALLLLTVKFKTELIEFGFQNVTNIGNIGNVQALGVS